MSKLASLALAVLSCPLAAASGEELFVGFSAGASVFSGDADTLELASAAQFGPVRAMCPAGGAELWIAAGAEGSELTRFDGARKVVLAGAALLHPVAALARGETALFAAGGTGALSALDPATGALLGSSATGFAVRALVADAGRLYLATATGEVWSAAEGSTAWQLELSSFLPAINALAVRGSSLLVAVSGHVFVYQRDTGFLMYGYNVPNDAMAIALEGNDVVVGGSDGSVVRVDPASGDVLLSNSMTAGPGGAPLPVSAVAVTHAAPFAALAASTTFTSLAEPHPVLLRLEVAPDLAALPFLVLGTASGTSPGIVLAGMQVPLALDPYFLLTLHGSPTLLGGFGGFSDENALGVPMADASFQLPPGLPPALAGLFLHHAFIVFDPAAGAVRAASNPVATGLLP